ncbi:MAG: 3'-5' exonuclease, partial [Eubacteriales bacterium]|nr:3'-5' exonuclease [Eubacteriales bacterium]
ANEHAPEEVIGDFLLFAGNSIMVGYNVNFDYQFIQITAQKIGKKFDNEFRDCMVDAKAKLFLPNYKLGTVVDHLGVNLNNAHRALHDATATAEAFLKLSLL